MLDPESIIFKAQKGHFQIRGTFVLYDGTFIAYSKDLEELLKSNRDNDAAPAVPYSEDSEEWKAYLSLIEGADHILHPVGYFGHNREMELKTIERAKSIFKNLKDECKPKSPDKKKEAKKLALLKEEEGRRAESAEKRTYLRNRMKYEKKSSSNIYLKKVEEFADRYLSHLTDVEEIWMLSNEQAIWKEEFKKHGDILVAKNELFKRIRKAGKEDPMFMDKIKDYILAGEIKAALSYCRNVNTPSARMIEKGISRLGRPVSDVQAAIENVGNIEVAKLEKGLTIMATIAAGAPMIGFLGTVTGMVRAFFEMANAGNNIDITLLSGGIYEAMITTVGGLIVGIIAMFAYNYLVTLVDGVVNKMEAKTMAFMDLLNEPC